jgi:hypothetical protein
VALDSSYFTEHPELVTLLLLLLLLLSLLLLLLLLLSQGHDVAVARAVADMRLLAEFCLPFVRPGGVWVAAKGASPEVSVSVTASVACVVAGLARKGGGVRVVHVAFMGWVAAKGASPEVSGSMTAISTHRVGQGSTPFIFCLGSGML